MKVETRMDPSGMGKVWQVFVNDVLVWSHAAIEGPVPDALDLWERLDTYFGVNTGDAVQP